MDHNVNFLSFSQRKFVGFRKQIEFDQKRILLASKDRITILGIHPHSDRPFQILSCRIPGFSSGSGNKSNMFGTLKDSAIIDQEESKSQNTKSIDVNSDRDIHDKLQAQLNRVKQNYQNNKEEVIKVCFVLDRIPSYILVVSRKLSPEQPERNDSEDSWEYVADGEVIFRIISLSVTPKNQTNVLDTISELSKNEDYIEM